MEHRTNNTTRYQIKWYLVNKLLENNQFSSQQSRNEHKFTMCTKEKLDIVLAIRVNKVRKLRWSDMLDRSLKAIITHC